MPLSSSGLNNSSVCTTSSGSFEYTTTNIPAFLSKLWTLVEDSKYDELIAWDSVWNEYEFLYKLRSKLFYFFLKSLVLVFTYLIRLVLRAKFYRDFLNTIIWQVSYDS